MSIKKKEVKKRVAKSNQGDRSPNQKAEESFNQGSDQLIYPRMSVIQASKRENPDYEQLNIAVHDYLLKRNYHETLELFKLEMIKKYQSPQVDIKALPARMMEAFDHGQREMFFHEWDQLLPPAIRYGGEEATRLEFYLQIFFVIYPLHPLFRRSQQVQNFNKEAIQKFKIFLETQGSELSKTSEFLPYYALPYIQKPIDHPILKPLFSKEWVFNLKDKLKEFITGFFENEDVPHLLIIYKSYLNLSNGNGGSNMGSQVTDNSRYASAIAQLENKNNEYAYLIKELNQKYQNLQINYKNFADSSRESMMESQKKWGATCKDVVGISKEFIRMIENLKRGLKVDENVYDQLVGKTQKYDSFLGTNIEDLISQSQDLSIFEKVSTFHDNEQQLDGNSISPHSQLGNRDPNGVELRNPYPELDYKKVIVAFSKKDNEHQVCPLLQALRWRITRTKGSYIRREVIISYSSHDILGCSDPKPIIIKNLLIESSQRTKELTLRLINALASDFQGRSYLVSSEMIVKTLISILQIEESDNLVRRNSLGALQKLSLRKKPQIVMINENLIKWIIETLKKEKETLSEYSYEYSTALLMNLSLRSAGKEKCENPKDEVLKVLNELLEHENIQVRTFVNGTLYSLFSRAGLREQAKAMGMKEVLTYLMENSDERFTKQIQYIMDQLEQDKPEEESLSVSTEEDNEVDEIDEDEELGEDEDLDESYDVAASGKLNGEEFLKKEFLLTGNEAIQQSSAVKSMMGESRIKENSFLKEKNRTDEELFKRPTTPSMALLQSHGLKSMNLEDKGKVEEARKNLPSELKSRPKLPRTPLNGDRSMIENQSQINNDSQKIDPKVEQRKKAENSEEYKDAFVPRDKILRTPPGDKKKH